MTYLLDNRCPHIEIRFLDEALEKCAENSFVVHEGCATLCEFSFIEETQPGSTKEEETKLDDDYRYALSSMSRAVDLFGFSGYLRSWIAMQVAAVCLSPRLFGPLSNFMHYHDGAIGDVFEEDKFSADRRLQRIIDDGEKGCLADTVKSIRTAVNDCVVKVFPTPTQPDFNNTTLRHRFISICEPAIETLFSKTYPEFYYDYRAFLREWKNISWPAMISGFRKFGCDCLTRFSFRPTSLMEGNELTRPVATPNREGHFGAIKINALSDLPVENGQQYCNAGLQ